MIRTLLPELQEKAEKELNEVPSRIPSDIRALKAWLEKQPHLQSVKPPEQMLVAFLRGNKYSIERSKEKLDMYYTLKALLPELYSDRNPFNPTIQEILKLGILLPLKTCAAKDSVRVCLGRYGLFDNSKHKLTEFLKVVLMIFEILMLEDDNYVIAGVESILDVKGASISSFFQWTPAIAKKLVVSVEKSFPVRMKANYVLHSPPGFETVYAMIRIFMTEKLKNRVYIYSDNVEKVYKKVPQHLLPKEYGGENGTIQEMIDHWKTKVENYNDWFKVQAGQHSDESLRPEKPRTSSSLFGVEGSFRKLEVD